jgi:hypothetical protein
MPQVQLEALAQDRGGALAHWWWWRGRQVFSSLLLLSWHDPASKLHERMISLKQVVQHMRMRTSFLVIAVMNIPRSEQPVRSTDRMLMSR